MRDIAVDCAMRHKAGAWRIYDVALDGFSVIDVRCPACSSLP